MMEPTSNLYIFEVGRFCWLATHPASAMGTTGETRDEALKTFRSVWNDRASLNVIDGPPPAPKHPGEHAPIAEALEADEHHRRGFAKYRELLKSHHADVVGKRKFTADEVTRVIVELWQATK
jgi:hypothetical protein